jgi:hypothetical protein
MPPKPDTAPERRDPRRRRRRSVEHPAPPSDAGPDAVPEERGGSEAERDTNVNTTRV